MREALHPPLSPGDAEGGDQPPERAEGGPADGTRRAAPEDAAAQPDGEVLEIWLEHRLRWMYGRVLQEPVPDALLRIIDEDAARR